ncbi:NADP-dependent 3-hydroxy acid dehydrogenase YdfG [Parasphingorhabdus marina DSM 22363]|uniref:NADP-dependent 3-hydroxy acid dehydrogenase YdfG n=1 Tax=Parasphingorhabdus marina DSM 22363 TaxID=1123272 RepID=A0A1N6CUK6_9SPHN|nr:SDR family oxidoreductase [Parasphingorhabdus marina]SIN62149.1 NADP-dependent 3-hydroxy acid dehydrogenase YdfG [Parasphingorhabdus marina DSM 22363]
MRTAIVTGASSGIGEATARKLIADGYNVMLAARRADRLESLTEELGEHAAFHVTDVSSRADQEALAAATTERFGQVDALVCNAGIMPVSLIEKGDVEDWDRMIDVNLRGVLYGINAVLPRMVARKDGHVIIISSIAALENFPSSAVYSATKAGVRSMSDTLRKEMTAHGVRVTTIFPGGVKTELGSSIKDQSVLEMMGGVFNFEFLEPENLADSVAYVLNQPPSVCVGELMIRPTGQA